MKLLLAGLTLAAALSSPALAASSSLGPGTQLLIQTAGETHLCTAGFLFGDASGNLYLSTAGHCLLPADRTATHGPGADWNAANTWVRACVSSCTPSGLTGTIVTLGPASYARFTGTPESDVGFVRIPTALIGTLRPAPVPFCGGPEGIGTLSRGEPFCFFAQGAGRLGVGTGGTAHAWSGVGPLLPAEAGAPVVEVPYTPAAIGIVSDATGGPTVARMQALATQAGLTLTLHDASP